LLVDEGVFAAKAEEDRRRSSLAAHTKPWNFTFCSIELYAYSVYGRSHKELDEEEYNKMMMQKPTAIYLEAKIK